MESSGDEDALRVKRSGADTDVVPVEFKKCSYIGSAGMDGDLSDVYKRIKEPGREPALMNNGYMSGKLGELQMLAVLAATNLQCNEIGGFAGGKPSRDTDLDFNGLHAMNVTYQDMFPARRPSFVGMHDTIPDIITLPIRK